MLWIGSRVVLFNPGFLSFPLQNQAEAHYKGHKHARKLKAMEAQKNRQRRAGDASSTGKERERDRNKTAACEAALPALMDTSLAEGTSTYRKKNKKGKEG